MPRGFLNQLSVSGTLFSCMLVLVVTCSTVWSADQRNIDQLMEYHVEYSIRWLHLVHCSAACPVLVVTCSTFWSADQRKIWSADGIPRGLLNQLTTSGTLFSCMLVLVVTCSTVWSADQRNIDQLMEYHVDCSISWLHLEHCSASCSPWSRRWRAGPWHRRPPCSPPHTPLRHSWPRPPAQGRGC